MIPHASIRAAQRLSLILGLGLALVASSRGVTYTADNVSAFPNPERGYHNRYEIVDDPAVNDYASAATSIAGFNPDAIDRTFSRAKAAGNTLIHSYIHLDKYTGVDQLPPALLDNLASGLAAIRAAGLKIVLRPAYAWANSTNVPEARILGHIAQLNAVISANADVVNHLEAGWLGAWGEWHDSQYTDPFNRSQADTRYRIVKQILDTTPASIPVALRYPIFVKEILELPVPDGSSALTTSDRDRIGFHNDCFLSDSADMGTYDQNSWMGWFYTEEKRQWVIDYITSYNGNKIVGGETCDSAGNNDAAGVTVQQQMSQQHWTEINEDFAAVNVNIWKNANLAASGNDPAETAFTRIKRKLGYRFRLVSATFPTTTSPGSSFGFTAGLSNDGYASPLKPRPVFLVFDDGTHRYNVPVPNTEVRAWRSGPISLSQNIALPNMASGTYTLALWLPDPTAALQSRPEYSIRLANTGIWDPAKGYNVLANALTVGPPTAPAAPANLTAAAGNAQVTLSWSAVANADSYSVLRSTTNGTGYSQIAANVAAAGYVDTGVSNDVTYYYVVRAVNTVGTSGSSNQASATPNNNVAVPSAPTNVTAAAGNAQAAISWTASTGATSYTVLRSTTSGSGYTQIATGVSGSPYTDIGLANGTTYFYVVRAVNSAGSSGNSAQASTTPSAPQPLVIDSFPGQTSFDNHVNDLGQATSWSMDSIYYGSDSVGNVIMNSGQTGQYFQENINRSLAGGTVLTLRLRDWYDSDTEADWNVVLNDGSDHTVGPLGNYGNVTGSYTTISIPLAAFSANLANVQSVKIVHRDATYAVLMIDAIGADAGGSGGGGGGDTQAPTAPTNLTSPSKTATSVSLTWTAATDNIGVTAYDVRRNGTTVGSPTMTSFTDTGLTANTAYTYTVTARDAAGNASSTSAPLSVTTSAGSGSGEAVSYEAESSGNTLAGGAVVASSANCSGGAKVGYVGNGGTLTFNNVSSGSSGDFVLSLVYLAAETRGVQVTINNGTPVTLSLPSSGGWDTLATYDLTVSLNAGTNTIRLANPGGWAPDFDRIILSTGGGVDIQAPSVPANLAIGSVTTSSIALSWSASTDNVGVAGYVVRRGGAVVGDPAGTSFTDTGLESGTSYTYTVAAVDAAGNASAPSSAATGTTAAAPDTQAPTAPTGLSASAGSTTVQLTWTAATDNVGVTGYIVFRNDVQVGTSTSAGYHDSGLTASTAYTYYVKARDAAGNQSAASSALSVTTAQSSSSDETATVPGGQAPTNPFPVGTPDASLPAHALVRGADPLTNPMKGGQHWFYSGTPAQRPGIPTSMRWRYFGLGELMTGPGAYDWSVMDDALNENAWGGMQMTLRVATCNSGHKDLPDFLQPYVATGCILRYNDPYVLQTLIDFIVAFGARYDGDPRISYIEMGLIGDWGEWHTWLEDGGTNQYMISDAGAIEIMDAYAQAFKKTPVLNRYARSGGLDLVGEQKKTSFLTSLARIGYHDDSFAHREADPVLNNQVLSMTLPQSLGGKTDGFVQIALDYGAENKWITAVHGGEFRPEEIGTEVFHTAAFSHDKAIDALEAAHVSFLTSDQGPYNASDPDEVAFWKKMGYILHVDTAYYPAAASGDFKVGIRVQNTGVAPFAGHPSVWRVELGLKDGAGNVVKTWTTGWDFRTVLPLQIRALPDWNLPGNPTYTNLGSPVYFETTLSASNVAAGSYHLVLRVRNPLLDYTESSLRPLVQNDWLPYLTPWPVSFANATQGNDGWLDLGTMTVN
jgi:chitodextrinase